MDEALGKLFGGIVICLVVIYVVLWVVAIAMVLASLCVGIVAFLATKSRKALVLEEEPGPAFVMALGWSSVLTVGCMIGSLGLLSSLSTLLGTAFEQQMVHAYGLPQYGTAWSAWIFLDKWLMTGAYVFWAKTVLLLYFANRVHLARGSDAESYAWLGVLPPLFGLAVFAVADHWELVLRLLAGPTASNASVLMHALWNTIIIEPIELARQALIAPDTVFAWLKERIVASEGSFFRLKLFSFIFWIIALAFTCRAIGELAGQDAP
jgi:hypothetical protein